MIAMKICLFDIDGTLIHTGGAGQSAMATALADQFGLPPDTDGVSFAGRTDRAIIGDLFHKHGVEDSEHNWDRFQACYVALLDETLPAKPGRVLPGVRELLDQLDRRDDVAMGLLTGNLRAGAAKKMAYFQLDRFFTFGGYGDVHRERDAVAVEALADAHRRFNGQSDAAGVWVVGDTPMDVSCARAIDACAVAVLTGWHARERLVAAEPDLLLDDLSDPAPLMQLLDDRR